MTRKSDRREKKKERRKKERKKKERRKKEERRKTTNIHKTGKIYFQTASGKNLFRLLFAGLFISLCSSPLKIIRDSFSVASFSDTLMRTFNWAPLGWAGPLLIGPAGLPWPPPPVTMATGAHRLRNPTGLMFSVLNSN